MILKSGMNVRLKNGDYGIVIGDYIQTWRYAMALENYDDDLICTVNDSATVIEVYDKNTWGGFRSLLKEESFSKLIHHRYSEKLNQVGD